MVGSTPTPCQGLLCVFQGLCLYPNPVLTPFTILFEDTQATVRSSLPAGAAVSAVTEVGLDHTSDQLESPPTVTRRVVESSDEESGGSSDEEETAHSHGQLSTAPTTPAALHHDHHPLMSPDGGSEGLPVYKGGDHPEAAIASLKEKPVLPPIQDAPQVFILSCHFFLNPFSSQLFLSFFLLIQLTVSIS